MSKSSELVAGEGSCGGGGGGRREKELADSERFKYPPVHLRFPLSDVSMAPRLSPPMAGRLYNFETPAPSARCEMSRAERLPMGPSAKLTETVYSSDWGIPNGVCGWKLSHESRETIGSVLATDLRACDAAPRSSAFP